MSHLTYLLPRKEKRKETSMNGLEGGVHRDDKDDRMGTSSNAPLGHVNRSDQERTEQGKETVSPKFRDPYIMASPPLQRM